MTTSHKASLIGCCSCLVGKSDKAQPQKTHQPRSCMVWGRSRALPVSAVDPCGLPLPRYMRHWSLNSARIDPFQVLSRSEVKISQLHPGHTWQLRGWTTPNETTCQNGREGNCCHVAPLSFHLQAAAKLLTGMKGSVEASIYLQTPNASTEYKQEPETLLSSIISNNLEFDTKNCLLEGLFAANTLCKLHLLQG